MPYADTSLLFNEDSCFLLLGAMRKPWRPNVLTRSACRFQGCCATRRHDFGVSLIEVLFAIGVIVIGGLWLLGAFQSGIQLTDASQDSSVAIEDLKDMMERIKTTPFNANLPVTFPDGVAGDETIGAGADVGTGADQYPAVVGVDLTGDGVRDYTLSSEQITVTYRDKNGNAFAGTPAQKQTAIAAAVQAQDPLQVIVTVSWVTRGRTYTKNMATMKAS